MIGAGGLGYHHVRILRDMQGPAFAGFFDARTERAEQVARELGVTAHSSLEALLDVVDAVTIVVPTPAHFAVAREVLARGIHALIEKPIAHSIEAGDRLVKAFETAGVVGCVGHIERYNPALQSLRERMADGDLGEIYQIATRRQGPFPARIADVGVVKDLATHDIDLTAWLAQSEYTAVAAQVALRSGRPHEDMVAATGKLANGTITNHLVNWLSPMKERVTVVTGEKGAYVADTLTADLTFYANGVVNSEWDAVANFRGVAEGDVTRFAIPKREPLRTEHERFRDAVLGKSSEIVTMQEAQNTLRTAENLLRTARQPVDA